VSDATKAVFLSYASQDAEAAKRIADALRADGVEVWFDQNELVGGDAWDGKIRRQIKECALLVPIISANTQSRAEGYFRLEWRLADQRTHLMGRGRRFLLPVCIDDTKDADADVPDSFTAVQWTRAKGGELPRGFIERVKRLLEGDGGRDIRVSTPPGGTRSDEPALQRRISKGWWALPVLAAAAAVFLFLRQTLATAPLVRPTPAAQLSAAGASTEFPHDPDLKRVYRLLYNVVDGIAEDFALMDDIVNPLLKARPNDPEVVTVAAELAQEFVTRGFDISQARRAQAQRLTERAVQLAPDNPEALAALGYYLYSTGNQLGRAEELLRRAIKLQPAVPRFHCFLLGVLGKAHKPTAEIEAFAAQMAATFPTDPMVAYRIAGFHASVSHFAAAEEWLDKSLALAPVPYAILSKAQIMLEVHGDVPGMERMLELMPERQRTSASLVNAYAVLATVTGQTGPARRVVEATADTWLADGTYIFPKALLAGELEQLDGHDEVARRLFQAALNEIRARMAADPTELRLIRAELWAQIELGHHDEALAALGTNLEKRPRPYRWTMNFSWWTSALRGCLLLGERAQAMVLLKEACAEAPGRLLLRNLLRVDPAMAPFRDDPEIVALLAEPAGMASADSAGEKSVAVLAFANLSDDKANEYFSDGISEELLNVLGRVPGLRVAAPMSAFSFKGRNVSAQEIGQKLNVAYLVSGSVRWAGPAIRVVARLSRANTDEQIWTEKFEGEARNVFALQDEIAAKIAAALSLKLGAATREAKPINPEAYRLYLEGRHLWSLRNLEAFDRAEAAFTGALRIDPDSALLQAGRAELYATRALYRAMAVQPEAGDLDRAAEAADRAIALDPKLAQGYVARATIALARQDYMGAERWLRQSLTLSPNDALALNRLGDAMIGAGRLDIALDYYRRALQLDPLSVFMVRDVIREATYAHQFQEAIDVQQRFEAAVPQDAHLAVGHFHAQVKLGRVEQARVDLKANLPTFTPDNFPGPGMVEWVFYLREANLEAESEELARQLLAHYGPGTYLHPFILMARGRAEEALPLLKQFPPGSQDRLYWSPIFDPVRDDPRFLHKIDEMGAAVPYRVARETLARMLKVRDKTP
jgi:TolB-like protein/Flp pilus assembly protein TadD